MAHIPQSVRLQGDIDVVPHPTLSDGGAGALRVNDKLFVFSTTPASGPESGAVQIAGGASVGGGVYVNEDLAVNGSTTTGTSLSIDAASVFPLTLKNRNAIGSAGLRFLDVSDTEQMHMSYSNATGKSFIESNNSTLAITTNGNADQLKLNTDGTISVASTVPSSSKTTGSCRVGGGLGVADAVFQNFSSSSTGFASDSGSSVQGNMHYRLMAGGVNRWAVNLAGVESGGDLNGSDFSVHSYGSTGVFAGTLMRMTRAGVTSFPSTVASTDKLTGSVVCAGGVGISGATNATTINATDVQFTSAHVNGALYVKSVSLSSTNNDDLIVAANANSLYLRNTPGSTAGQLQSTLTNFAFFNTAATPVAGVTIDKASSDVAINSSTPSTGKTSGALRVTGGIGCEGNIFASGLNATSLNSTAVTNTGVFQTGTLIVTGTDAATSTTDGPVRVYGGIAVEKKSYIQAVVVPGSSTLNTVSIDTSNTALTITGTQGIDSNTAGNVAFVSASGDIGITSTVGDVTLTGSSSSLVMGAGIETTTSGSYDVTAGASSTLTVAGTYFIAPTGRANISAGSTSANAVSLVAANAAGGITASAGTSGITATTTGKFDLTSTSAASQWIHTQTGAAHHLNIALAGTGNSVFSLASSGSTSNALDLYSSVGGIRLRGTTSLALSATGGSVSLSSPAATGPMTITQTATATSQGLAIALQGAFANVLSMTSAGTGTNALSLSSTAGGISQTAATSWSTAVTAGAFSLTSTNTSLIQQTSGADGLDFTVALVGANAGSSRLVLSSTGTGVDAVKIASSAGGCDIQSVKGITGAATAGAVSFSGRAASGASFTHKASGPGQDMHVGILQDGASAATSSRLVLEGFGSGADAILLQSSPGGITATSEGPISLDTSHVSGVFIGTTHPGIPVTLGNATSTVTVNDSLLVSGNLTVAGMVTIFDTQVMTVTDSTIVLHSGPSGTSDSGIVTERFQEVDMNTGDIVSDAYNETGFCQTGSTISTIVLNGTASAVADHYRDWWVKIVQGTGTGQIRKIKSYTPGTYTAVIYANGEPSGQNWATVPDTTSKYELYGHTFAAFYYSEISDYYDVIYTNKDPVLNSYFNVTGRPQVRMGSLRVDGAALIDTINPMYNAGINIAGMTITNGALAGVTSINGASVSQTEVVTLPDNNSSSVTITGTGLTGAFQAFVESVEPGGPQGIFTCCKPQAGTAGQVNRQGFGKGAQDEVIDITYTANNKAKLKYSKNPGDGLSHGFIVKLYKI